ncbi:MAG: endonuclease V, partial [Bacteroidota bacterium]
QGIAHPRRMGEACHFGLLTGIASIGCAKKNLVGTYEEPPKERGAYRPIQHQEEVVGYALCTKDGIKPVFISPGYAIDLEESRDIALYCARGYKIPEPTRQAHLLVNRLRRGEIEPGVWQRGED